MPRRLSLRLVPLLFPAVACAQIAPDALGASEAVARGVSLRRGACVDPQGRPQWVAALDVDPATDGVRFELALANGLEPTSLLAARGGAAAAINGGFFSKERQPLGAFRLAGVEASAGSRAYPA